MSEGLLCCLESCSGLDELEIERVGYLYKTYRYSSYSYYIIYLV